MLSLSRRNLFAAAAAAPFATAHSQIAAARTPTPVRRVDPVASKIRQWIVARENQDALVRKWQDLENQLCDRIKSSGVGLTAAYRSGLPEARQMRALTRQIKLSDRKLDRTAVRIILSPARSTEGALAKIEMGLRIQEPQDCEEHAWALLRSGFEELSGFVRDHGALDRT